MKSKPDARQVKTTKPDDRDVLTIIGKESQRNGTDALTDRQIDRIIETARKTRSKK